MRKNKQEQELMKRRNVVEINGELYDDNKNFKFVFQIFMYLKKIFIWISDDIDGERPLTDYDLRSLVEEAASDIPDVQLKAIQSARKLLSSDRNPPIDELINSEILPILVQCLNEHNK